jgi:hypothetical protein
MKYNLDENIADYERQDKRNAEKFLKAVLIMCASLLTTLIIKGIIFLIK